MSSKHHLLIFIAGQNELEAFCHQSLPEKKEYQGWDYYDYQPQISLVRCGIGSFNALACAECLFSSQHVTHCLNIGFSGSHRPDLEIGQIVLATSTIPFDYHTKTAQKTLEKRRQAIQRDKQIHHLIGFESDSHFVKQLKSHLSRIPHLRQGVIGSSNQFNRNLDFIQQVRTLFGTECEDMESAAIAYSAFRHQVPFAALRIISNNEFQDKGKSKQGQKFDPIAFRSLSLLGESLAQWEI